MMKKIDIAKHQLDRAISLFLNENDFICAITLGGAAEEILGKEIQRHGNTSACDDLTSILRKKYAPDSSQKEIRNKHLNSVRNAIKHFNDENEQEVDTNWEAQAIQMLARCCINIIRLDAQPTEQFHRFIERYQNDNRYNNI